MSEDEAANAEQEQIEERLRATEDQLKSLRDSTITRSTWGLFFVLLAVIGLLVFIFLYLLALFSAGASLTPSILVTLISVISLLIAVLLLWNEQGLLERARELQRITKDLQRKVEERSAEDREREGERDRR